MEKDRCQIITVSPTVSTESLLELIREQRVDHDYLLIRNEGYEIDLPQVSLRRMVEVAKATDAILLYSDYKVMNPDGSLTAHPLATYQGGSVRDDFDFGPQILIDLNALKEKLSDRPDAKEEYSSEHSGLYALRLFIASDLIDKPGIVHLPEYLYVSTENDRRTSGEKQFDYVNPRNASVQKERERVFTQFLRDIKAALMPVSRLIDPDAGKFPVEASVIIPVRDRARTIAEAVESALSQDTPFDFNVIVIDNHSTDGTTEIVAKLATTNPRVIHLIPTRLDLGIGGCWDLAIRDRRCGRFAIQLDSDDKYKESTTLTQIVDCFRRERCAMVIGSYELTDFDGNPIPPGLIDHKEWTPDNGHNNALRINGLGAPRAFHTPVLREIGVPNVSYGEDYALGLRISREYKIGRIYDSLYLCRRWQGNSDADLSQERVNANNRYKDWLRTVEIEARRKIVLEASGKYLRQEEEARTEIERFYKRQLRAWPLAQQNHVDLYKTQVRCFEVCGQPILAGFNPARAISSGAKTDKVSIAARPCFLCGENRPGCQRKMQIADGYSLLVNPYPLGEYHFTIASDTHQPQSITACEPDRSSRYSTMFDLALKLPRWLVFYNGPRCGASAPDHMHFQALRRDEDNTPRNWDDLTARLPYKTIRFAAHDKEALDRRMAEIVDELSRLPENQGEEEPRMNIFMQRRYNRAGYISGDTVWVDVLVIPRRAHRPSCYGTGKGEMMISPGAIDMLGWLVVPRKEDFDSLDDAKVEKILRETTYFKDC